MFIKSLGSSVYLSLLKFVDGVVGNSSSGIIDSPYLKVPTINIGDRQEGRLMSNSIINCEAKKNKIVTMLDNSWATPLYFSAINEGVDVSILAATKYISGHADVMLGHLYILLLQENI